MTPDAEGAENREEEQVAPTMTTATASIIMTCVRCQQRSSSESAQISVPVLLACLQAQVCLRFFSDSWTLGVYYSVKRSAASPLWRLEF